MQEYSYRHVFSPGYILAALLLFLIKGTPAFGQAYPLGINPPSLNWQQINTDKVQVIYPEQLEYKAQRVANLVHMLYDSGYYTLGPRRQKVSIILQNQNTISNGFVTVSPFRSEFYLTPPQYSFLGNMDWTDGLTVHEYRHVEQFVNAKENVTKIGYLLFGQNGWGVTAGLALPRWFFEGDAVFYETVLSQAGRGRMPDFENDVRAMLLTRKKIPGYELASATSYKEFIPNHYNLGYYLTTSMRKKYGNEVMSQIVDYAVSYRSVIFPFSFGLKKYTDQRTPQFYKSTMSDLKSEWSKEISNLEITPTTQVNTKKKRTVTSYRLPALVNDSTLIAMKSGFRDISQIVSLDIKSGKEKKMVETGFISGSNATLSTNGRFVVWAELGFDPRWELRDYSNIKVYDLQTDEESLITKKERLFAPAISLNGEYIAAVKIGLDMKEQLALLTTSNGQLLDTVNMNEGTRIAFPSWKNDREIIFVMRKNDTNALANYNRENHELNIVSPYWTGMISYPKVDGDDIYFSAIFDGTDNIYRWNTSKQKLYQVTTSEFGAQQPAINSKSGQLYYADYTWKGYNIGSVTLYKDSQKEIQKTESPGEYIAPLVNSEAILDRVPDEKFPTSRLKETKGLFNLHSWTPWFLPPNFGVILEADNIMSTFSAEGSFSYNTNEMASSYGINIEYAKYFPVVHLNATRSERSRYLPVTRQDSINGNYVPVYSTISNSWFENDLSAGITLPFNTTLKNYYSKIWITNQLHYKTVDYSPSALVSNEQFGAYTFDLSAYFLKRMARQHLYPRLGLTWDMSFRTTFKTVANESDYFQNQLRLYLPGLLKTHHIRLDLSYQKDSFLSPYKFKDDFFYARGYGAPPHDEINNVGINYALPLLYPDLPLGPFIFIQRVKANFFFDRMTSTIDPHQVREFIAAEPIESRYLSATFPTRTNSYRSYGVETTFDIRLFRSLDANLGVRFSYLMDPQPGSSRISTNFLLFSIGI